MAARFFRSASTCICIASWTRDGNRMSPMQQQKPLKTSGQRIMTNGRIAPALVTPVEAEFILKPCFTLMCCTCGQVCNPMLLGVFVAYTV